MKEFPKDQTFQALEKAISDENINEAFQASHTLKGLAGNLSIDGMYEKLIRLTDSLRGEGNMALAKTLFPDVKSDYEQVVGFIVSNM